jgi:alanine racemase
VQRLALGPGEQSCVEIDLTAVHHNVKALLRIIKPSLLCAVVKANAYGHGDFEVAQVAITAGARWLAVALVEEGIRLRQHGVEAPILLLSEPPPGAMLSVAQWRITPTVYTKRALSELADVSPVVGVHVKVDTGMHRVGVAPSRLKSLLAEANRLRIPVEALWTHFATADTDPEFVEHQILAFDRATAGIQIPTHMANTAGAIKYEASRRSMCRIGIGLYGVHPHDSTRSLATLIPALRWTTRVVGADSESATIPVGFANGISRILSRRGWVLIRGHRCRIEDVAMMHTSVRAPRHVSVGDEVVLIGEQNSQMIDVEAVAMSSRTIPYEVLSRLEPRSGRRYTLQIPTSVIDSGS